MNIKDIRKYRTFFKEKVREIDSSNRNEHFAGVRHQKEDGENVYGFFDIYHGDKAKNETDGIRGFLEGFLDMARDAQAVYEFLQNAVDANSSHFAMFWGTDEEDDEDYLIVLNNGCQFDLPAVRSILNVGVSTKNSEEHTIGKFGIGFKLAHRLVGKDNGLDELIHENYGPILFSWKNNEILDLANGVHDLQAIDPIYSVRDDIPYCQKDDPWLFKILITNFPCQPGESIFNPHFKEVPEAFSQEEFRKMKAWTKKITPDLPLESYKEGSLFFIRLGRGKKDHLGDANLETGVRFSLAILNQMVGNRDRELRHINLNGKELESVQLDYVQLTIEKGSSDYNWIRFGKRSDLTDTEKVLVDKDEDIHFLMGYTDIDHATQRFEDAPNFYLFFPLSEEKHRLKFILHCNAFYKASHRTSLHVGTEDNFSINERLLSSFTEKLRLHLEQLVNGKQEERAIFLSIYASLLLSEKSEDINRIWINTPLLEPLFDYLAKHIPVQSKEEAFNIESFPEKVKIKKTALPIDPVALQLGFAWFYWSERDALHEPAADKLSIDPFTIYDLLKIEGISKDINELLDKQPGLRPLLLEELEAYLKQADFGNSIFENNFYNLQLFSFDDQPGISINALNNQDLPLQYLINFDKITTISHFLQQVGFKTSKEDLITYPDLLDRLRSQQRIKYISNYTLLNEVLSERLCNNEFTPEEKWQIFSTLEKATKDDRSEDRDNRMQVLKLFKNQNKDVVRLKNLLLQTEVLWLSKMVVHADEHRSQLDRYLISDSNKIYDYIIHPLWSSIIENHQEEIAGNITDFYETVLAYYKEADVKNYLSAQNFFFTGSTFYNSEDAIFFHSDLHQIEEKKYKLLKEFFADHLGLHLPVWDGIPFLGQAPFNLSNSNFEVISIEDAHEIDRSTVLAILQFAYDCHFPIFDTVVVENCKEKDQFQIRPKSENERPVFVEDENLADYIKQYHTDYVILPPFQKVKELVHYKDQVLVDSILDEMDWSDKSQSFTLYRALKNKGEETIISLLDRLRAIVVDVSSWEGYDSLTELTKLALPHHGSPDLQKAFANKILVKTDTEQLWQLSEVLGSAVDTVYFGENNEYDIKISELFSDEQTEKSVLVDRIITKLNKDGIADLAALRNLFGVNAQIEKLELLGKIMADVEQQGSLKNAAQLAFFLLYRKYEDPHFSWPKQILKKGDHFVNLEGELAVDQQLFPFFKTDVYLDPDYAGITDLLHLDHNQPYFSYGFLSLYLYPAIKDRKLYGPPFKESREEEIPKFLDALLQIQPENSKLELSDINWVDILGFNPAEGIVHPFRLIDDESLPTAILSWLNDSTTPEVKSKKRSLLIGMGVNFGGSTVVRLRRRLLSSDKETTFEVREVSGIPSSLLVNSLKLLVHKHYILLIADQDHILLIQEVIRQLMNRNDIGFPLPFLDSDSTGYHFRDIRPLEDYYWDSGSIVDLLQYQLTLKDVATSLPAGIYDAKTWGEHHAIKDQFRKIILRKAPNKEILDRENLSWQKPFYKKYRQDNGTIEIFQLDAIPYQFFIDDHWIKNRLEEDIYIEDEKIYVSTALSDSRILELIKHSNEISAHEIQKLENELRSYRSSIHELLESNLLDNQELQEKLDAFRKELEQNQQKEALKDRLQEEKYTYQWFLDFMQLHAMQDQSADSISSEKEIVFFDFEKEPQSDRLLVLKDPNRTVTPTIEYCADFHASFVKLNGSKKEVKIQGVSKKGQRLWAMVANPNDLTGLNAKDYKRVELRFSRSIDLLERLHRAFQRLGNSQDWEASFNLKEHLPLGTNFIFGPPGTGKTTTIARQVIDMMHHHDSDFRIIVLTPTNKAADVLTEKIMELLEDAPAWLVRYGAAFSNEIIENDLLWDANSFVLNKFKQCALITTIHRYPYEEVLVSGNGDFSDKRPLCFVPWDQVIFDEASMIPLNYIIFSMFQSVGQNDETSFIIGGDPFQIPPVVDIPNEDLPDDFNKEENIYSMVGLNTFREEEQQEIPRFGDKITNLKTQYRSIEPIGKLFSHFSYHGLLDHGRNRGKGGSSTPRQLPEAFQELGFHPISLVRFPVNGNDSIYRPGKLRKSPYHVYSALLILELIRKLDQCMQTDDAPWTVGIICPYRSQATLMNKMIESLNISPHLTVITDTVHGFQGDQCDIVFFLLSPSNYRISRDARLFLHKDYLINVAISRARDHLFVFYPDDETDGIENLYKVKEGSTLSLEIILKKIIGLDLDDITLQAVDLENAIFGETRHIEKNIFTNKHQMVNVYSKAEKKYLVREDTVAIDVQFRPES